MDTLPPITETITRPFNVEPQALLGTWRRFGPIGPTYEIVGFAHPDDNGNARMRIRVVESGEEVDYRLTEILDDPKER